MSRHVDDIEVGSLVVCLLAQDNMVHLGSNDGFAWYEGSMKVTRNRSRKWELKETITSSGATGRDFYEVKVDKLELRWN